MYFRPPDTLFNYIEAFKSYNMRIIYGLVGNCLDGDILDYLSFEFKDYYFVGIGDIFSVVMWCCVIVDDVSIFAFFNTYCIYEIQAGDFGLLNIC